MILEFFVVFLHLSLLLGFILSLCGTFHICGHLCPFFIGFHFVALHLFVVVLHCLVVLHLCLVVLHLFVVVLFCVAVCLHLFVVLHLIVLHFFVVLFTSQ